MSGTWGNKIKYTIFGESHGQGIGIVIDCLPPGIIIDIPKIQAEMQRRHPGSHRNDSPRMERDNFEIVSGLFNGRTTGTPLCAFIMNTDQHTKDYEELKSVFRPGHADFTGYVKYNGFNDYRGGGHFSGRLTASLVFAGAVAKQLLSEKNIVILSHVLRIGQISDMPFDALNLSDSDFSQLAASRLPTLDKNVALKMEEEISAVKAAGDSIGGIVETAVLNLPAGLGAPFFDSLESIISHLVFSIPGIKGIEFGDGFALAAMKGSASNDAFIIKDGSINTATNHCGGILGGISTGMPLIFRAVFKPTPSIAFTQNTVNIIEQREATISIKGRHDPCIVPRGLPVIEAAAAMAILDML